MRRAVSMLELVIAIVVMGIVAASVPMVLSQTNDNMAYTVKQEAIMAAKTRMGDIMTYDWDDRSYDTNNSMSFILATNSPNARLNDRNGTVSIGGVIGSGRRRVSPIGASATALANLGLDAGEANATRDDIDDFNGANVAVANSELLDQDADNLDYMLDNDMSIETTVTYANDNANYNQQTITFTFNPAAAGNSRNLKVISETITGLSDSQGNASNIVLRSFVANVGQNKPLEPRTF